MKYFVVSIQQQGDAAPCSISAYDDRDQAASTYHSVLASDYISETLDAFTVVMLNEDGNTELVEHWEKPEPEPNPDEEPDEDTEA